MKGIIIFEDTNPTLKNVYCIDLNNSDVKMDICPEAVYTLTGIRDAMKTASCNVNDTYDFETGALIALMKMCGLEKSAKAYAEIFDDTAYGDALIERDKLKGEIKRLKEKNAELLGANGALNYIKSCNESTIESLENTRDLLINKNNELIEENKKLKSDKDKSWKNYQRNIQKKQDRINELEAQVTASEDDKQKNLEYYEKEIKRLKEKVDDLYDYNKKLIDEIDQKNHEIIALKSLRLSNESLKKDNESFRKTCEKLKEENFNLKTQISVMAEKETELIDSNKRLSNKSETLNDALNTWKQRYRDLNSKNGELVVENYKLKTDCEKLQHGYIDTDMIFCGGRQNGKQYKALVNLFRKLPQDKIEAAYKEVFNTELPVWKKEFLNQMYSIYKESREKAELPRTLDVNGTTYRKTIKPLRDDQIASLLDSCKYALPVNQLTVDSLIEENRAFIRKCVDEWLYKPPTKREEMWENILNASKNPPVDIKVAKQDIKTFLKELQDKIPEAMWNGSDDCLPSEYTNPYWFKHDYIFFALFRYDNGKLRICCSGYKHSWIDKPVIEYIAPMRWDLFKKGRLAVKVTPDNYKEFYEACEKFIGKKPCTVYTGDYTVSICKKDGLFEVFTMEHQKNTGKKIVDWEDVR